MIRISKLKLNGLVLPALILAGLFLPESRSYAQESFQSSLWEIAGKISAFLTFRKPEISPEEKIDQEIRTRKESVEKIFDLTKLEQADLLNRLSNLQDLNDQQNKMRTALTEFVKENNNGLNEIESRLESANDLESIKKLASEFKDWRTLVYNPKTEKVVAFTFVFQGKNILSVAEERLANVKSDLSEYQNALREKDEKADGLLNKSDSHIKEAGELNTQARNLIMIALSNSLNPAKGTKVAEKEIARDIADSKAFTEKAMQHIRSAYNDFLELGKIISK